MKNEKINKLNELLVNGKMVYGNKLYTRRDVYNLLIIEEDCEFLDYILLNTEPVLNLSNYVLVELFGYYIVSFNKDEMVVTLRNEKNLVKYIKHDNKWYTRTVWQ
jgi:hypothetical protein